jgi:hypothetical protein
MFEFLATPCRALCLKYACRREIPQQDLTSNHGLVGLLRLNSNAKWPCSEGTNDLSLDPPILYLLQDLSQWLYVGSHIMELPSRARLGHKLEERNINCRKAFCGLSESSSLYCSWIHASSSLYVIDHVSWEQGSDYVGLISHRWCSKICYT